MDNLSPNYEKSLAFSPPCKAYTNSSNVQNTYVFNGEGRALKVSFDNYLDPFGNWIRPALQTIGQAVIEGFNTGKLIGSGYVPFTVDPKTASRSSSGDELPPRGISLHTTTGLQEFAGSRDLV